MFNVKDIQKMNFEKMMSNLTKLSIAYSDRYAEHQFALNAPEDSDWVLRLSITYRAKMEALYRWHKCQKAYMYVWHIKDKHCDGSEHKDSCGGF